MVAYKLFRKRKDGTLGPLFINKRQVIPVGKWLKAEDHPTKGYAHRPGWHVTAKKSAPHLNTTRADRVWKKVEIGAYKAFVRPKAQGGLWYLAGRMRILA